MKTEPLDYLLSAFAITLLAGLALAVMALLSYGVTAKLLGDYYVLADALLFLLLYGLFSALVCRGLVKRGLIRAGTFPMSDPVFRWWKLFTVIYEFGRGALLPFTTVFAKPLVAKLFGAGIGKDIALGGRLVDPQFVSIGDEAIVGQDSVITAHTITSGRIMLDPVVIGARATVGVNVVIMSGVQVGERAVLSAGAVVPPKTVIPAGELWGGVPARKIKALDSDA